MKINFLEPLIQYFKHRNAQTFEDALQDIQFNQHNDLKLPEPVRSPLTPYFKKEQYVNILGFDSRKFSKEDYQKSFEQHINIKNFLSEDKAPILKKLWEDSHFIYDALLPLEKLGIKYTIDLTGGCVRDFILGKHHDIKDCDVMFSISSLTELNFEKFSELFTQEEMLEVGFISNLTSNFYLDEQKKIQLLQMCLNRTQHVHQSYFFTKAERRDKVTDFELKEEPEISEEEQNDPYFEFEYTPDIIPDGLLGVIKLSGDKLNYPMDILITNLNKPKFLSDFDFDICKASFSIKNEVYQHEFPKDYSHFLSHFSANSHFWADVHNKTITYQLDGRSKKEIDRSFESHLKRLIQKYPDYQINLSYLSFSEKISKHVDLKQYAQNLLIVKNFEHRLPEHEHNVEIKRNKL